MALDGLDLGRWGGILLGNLGQLLTADDLNRVGTMLEQTLYNLMAVLCWDNYNSVPLQGFPEIGDHCLVTSSGGLNYSVAAGFGLLYDASRLSPSGDDYEANAYQPIVSSAISGTLSAHHATLPRYDIICLAPDTEDDLSGNRYIKSGGSVAIQSVYTRRRRSYSIQVIAGTPSATPTEPSVPTGYLKIARCEVPATSGAITVRDTRPIITLGHLLKPHPPEQYHIAFVPNASGGELAISATSPASMQVLCDRGRAVIRGQVRLYPRQLLTIGAADPTNGRYDLVASREDGTVTVTAGTAAPSPVIPSAPANSCVLAVIFVGPAVTTITSGFIFDYRAAKPFDGSLLNDFGLPFKKLTSYFLQPTYVINAESGNNIDVDMTIVDPDGVAPATQKGGTLPTGGGGSGLVFEWEAVVYLATGVEATAVTLTIVSGGSVISTDNQPRIFFQNTAGGSPKIRANTANIGNFHLVIRPVSHPGVSKRLTLTFA